MIWRRKKTEDQDPVPERSAEEENPQLSGTEGVPSDMSSMVIGGALPGPASLPAGGQLRYGDPALLASLDDAQVMLRVRDGDDAAFNYLVERYRRAMIGFLYRMVHDAAVAEDLAQEVFLRVYRSRSTYTADAKFTTWLYRIATNLGVNYVRDHKNERPEVKSSLDETDEETGLSLDVADSRINVEQQMLRRERMAAIRKKVEELPERQRMAVLMHKYQEMDYRQIAEVLHLSESATKSLLFRAYETLRVSLKDFV